MLHIQRSLPKKGNLARDKIVMILPDGNEVNIYLTKSGYNGATLSFEFPGNVKIYRSELWEKILNERI